MPPLVLAALFTAFLCWQANRIGRAIDVALDAAFNGSPPDA